MVAVGAIRYKLNPSIEVNMASAALLALGGVAGAFVGVEIVTRLPGSVLRRIFACFVIAVGLRMLFTPGRARPANDAAPMVRGEAGQVHPARPEPYQQAGLAVEAISPAAGRKANDGGGDR